MVPTYQLIAAVGSSFAAGPGIEPIVERPAMRSGRNYAHQLAERLGARLVDLTVSGATTANVIDTPQQLLSGDVYPPQLDGVPADADVVTITAGGNDLQFAGSMLYAAAERVEPQSQLAGMLRPLFAGGIPFPADDVVEQATAGLARVVEQARAKAPAARILLVDYLTVLDKGSGAATPFSDEELHQLLLIQEATARVFRDAASLSRPELILASSLSAGHALGSAEPWVQPFHPFAAQADASVQQAMMRTGASFHPNEAGMTAIAAELQRVLS
jgi:lysophospholipase L1-like esterase